ncbi:hypothetical protein [Micromonospora rhizosphaerae]|uniref:hypothetical protein n=1 Tax=Micromonospora rhizosphaerae TaxID=568872 RepID=UPI001C40660C|nr:hypothetical protein [Micromonospora rhizosphaerae]
MRLGVLYDVDGESLAVVSGGAHWGGGLWICADDLALLGDLYLRRGEWLGRRVLSEEWIERAWRPCGLNPDYGYLGWRNDSRRVQPNGPASGRVRPGQRRPASALGRSRPGAGHRLALG